MGPPRPPAQQGPPRPPPRGAGKGKDDGAEDEDGEDDDEEEGDEEGDAKAAAGGSGGAAGGGGRAPRAPKVVWVEEPDRLDDPLRAALPMSFGEGGVCACVYVCGGAGGGGRWWARAGRGWVFVGRGGGVRLGDGMAVVMPVSGVGGGTAVWRERGGGSAGDGKGRGAAARRGGGARQWAEQPVRVRVRHIPPPAQHARPHAAYLPPCQPS